MSLTRTLSLTNPLMHGADVRDVQHLLAAKGFPCAADGIFGAETAGRCVEAKQRLKYPKGEQHPTCGPPLVAALEAHKPFPPPPQKAARARYLAQLELFLTQRANWDYAQVRPIPHKGHVGRVRTDCSGAVTYAAELAGCPDPNGYGFNGQGWTGSLGSRCQHIPRALARPGDLVLFGPGYPWHHVGALLDAAPDPRLFSHGHPGDPGDPWLSAEIAGQARSGHPGVTYLRFLP